jgi:diguanylate cyclase (GGDEF)-like protein/PAS domain S-box-containing protein
VTFFCLLFIKDKAMPENPEQTARVVAEIEALRRQVAELQGIEKRYQQAESALRAFEERNRLLGDSTPLGIFIIDTRGRVTGCNRKMSALFSRLAVDDPTGLNLFDDRSLAATGIVADIRRCLTHKRPVVAERAHVDADGAGIHMRYYLSPIPASDGKLNGVMAIVEDTTDVKRIEMALQESESRYRQLFQLAPVALIEWDVSSLKAYLEDLRATGVSDFSDYLSSHPQQVHHCWSLIKTMNYNQAFLDLMGVADSAAHKGAFLPTDSGSFLKMAREIIIAAAAGQTADEREETLVTVGGETRIVFGRSLVVSDHEETMVRVVIALVDISQRKKAEAALRDSERRFREQAYRDGLTGLHNQRYLYQALAEWIARAKTEAMPISLIFMDIDRFKTVVDTYGHLNGSRAVHLVAGTVDSCLAPPAFAVAYAGDEFVVVLPGMDQYQALQKASQIRAAVKQTVYALSSDVEVRLQASFGVATFPQHASDLNGLIAAADQALFAVKKNGKDAVGGFQIG